MDKDDVIRMAREAGLHIATDHDWMPIIALAYAEKFAALIAAAEREECAQAAEAVVPRHTECGNKIAKAIRAKGDSEVS